MSVDKHRRSDELLASCEKLDADQRQRFLFDKCAGDWHLFEEVMERLRAGSDSDARGDRPLTPVPIENDPDSVTAPSARFRLADVLGEGGMSIVYLADQLHPVKRRVALKVIKLGIDLASASSRFESERQALALMNHPNIARVYEGGATDDGRLYFAMEYIPGKRITEYCDDNRLSIPDRVALFCEVCDAVHHAHQKGIIHRDLKPSNVMVTAANGERTAKVIDFGVAKATNQRLVEESLFTLHGLPVGSFDYMSPEQADASLIDTDTRTDIYSLGVLLHELLIGSLPLEVTALQQQGYAAMSRCLREDDPPPMSQSLGDRDDAEDIAQKRRYNASSMTQQLRRDLDWVVGRAIEKDPARRYASASELASDLRRYLRGDPVLACPPTWGYRVRKLLSRNRPAVAGAAAVLLTLLAGVAVSTGLYLQKRQATHLAQSQRDALLRLSDRNRLAALIDEAANLTPPHPEKIAAMEDWLARARELAGRLPQHQTTLDALRLAGIQTAGAGLRFDVAESQFHHDLLSALVDDLEHFVNADASVDCITDVQHRVQFARSVYERSVVAHRATWEAAMTAISDVAVSPQYGGLQITPQVGLVPLGPDANTGLWEFAHIQSGLPARRTAGGELVVEDDTGLVFVLIPEGCFWIGATTAPALNSEMIGSDPFARPDEGPPRRVCLEAFFLSKFEMTQAQWRRIMYESPSEFVHTTDDGAGRFPVENINWFSADSATKRMGLALPTEAQWEYAARSGTASPWCCGWDYGCLEGRANLLDSSAHGTADNQMPSDVEWNDGYVYSAPVGEFAPNEFGLHDMIGNVDEWCRDVYRPEYGQYTHTSWRAGSDRVCRGGDFWMAPPRLRVTWRINIDPESTQRIGVRPMRPLESEVAARGRFGGRDWRD